MATLGVLGDFFKNPGWSFFPFLKFIPALFTGWHLGIMGLGVVKGIATLRLPWGLGFWGRNMEL